MAKLQKRATGSLYSRLGINRDATDEQVRTAFYRLAKAFHPDRQQGRARDGEAFNKLVRAAAILRDPATRKLYDRGIIDEDGIAIQSRRPWPGWSYRERVLACHIAALIVLVSGVAFYSLDRSTPAFSPADAHAERKEEIPAAGAVPHRVSLALPPTHGKEPTPHLDDSATEALKPLRQEARAEPVPAAIAAAPADGRNQTTQKSFIIVKKPDAVKQRVKSPLSAGPSIPFVNRQEKERRRGECALTSAARDILAGIIARSIL